ncbi:hypothetical protein POLUDNITSA_00980 [Brevundimonas phage vB_BpoS-Poludnitsa]|nr:hypothetical protein POLUDNITSA_00980 [Brevundimonas phage vB_BpoS-Poludnitsa]
MTTPTTKNPYLLYKDEPPNWHSHGNLEPWEDYKKRIQAQNEMWWKVHTADGNYPHQTTTDLGIEGSDFPLGQGNRYGPFIYCPFPVEGIVRWAFRREDGFAAFRVDLANDSLPKGGSAKAVLSHAPIKRKVTAKDVALDGPEPKPIQSPPAADIDLSADLDLTAAEPDPFADLDMGSEPTASAVEPDPFADLDMGEPEAESAPAEPAQADDGEPEVDEWGEVIVKPKAAAADPFDL